MFFKPQLVNVIESIHEKTRATLLTERELHYLVINRLATKSTCKQEANLSNKNSIFYVSFI